MEKKKDTFTDATRQKRKKYMVGDNKQTNLTWNILRQGYTRQLCCYNNATKLQATHHIVVIGDISCMQPHLLHATCCPE